MIHNNYYDEEPDIEVRDENDHHVNARSPLFYIVTSLLLILAIVTVGIIYVPRWVEQNYPEVYDILGGNDTENYSVRGDNKQSIEKNPNQNSNGKQATSSTTSGNQVTSSNASGNQVTTPVRTKK